MSRRPPSGAWPNIADPFPHQVGRQEGSQKGRRQDWVRSPLGDPSCRLILRLFWPPLSIRPSIGTRTRRRSQLHVPGRKVHVPDKSGSKQTRKHETSGFPNNSATWAKRRSERETHEFSEWRPLFATIGPTPVENTTIRPKLAEVGADFGRYFGPKVAKGFPDSPQI